MTAVKEKCFIPLCFNYYKQYYMYDKRTPDRILETYDRLLHIKRR